MFHNTFLKKIIVERTSFRDSNTFYYFWLLLFLAPIILAPMALAPLALAPINLAPMAWKGITQHRK